jgi:hypothetical protein
MHALIREISAYSGADVLLGVFCSREAAETMRVRYREDLLSGRREDPWRRQAYKSDSLAEEDFLVIDLSDRCGGDFKEGDHVFVVSNYCEGCGQITREIRSVVGSLAEAEAKVTEIDSKPTYSGPDYGSWQEAVVGQALSDARENQPRL